MSDFERITAGDGFQGLVPEDFERLSKAIPSMIVSASWLVEQPALYHSRLPCFLHGFCYGGLHRLSAGDLAKLWEQGYLRDGEVFFFGGTGGFSASILRGLNALTGDRYDVRASAGALWDATQRVWCPDRSHRTVKRPDLPRDRVPFDEFVNTLLRRTGGIELSSVPAPLPLQCRDMRFPVDGMEGKASFITVPGEKGISDGRSGSFEVMQRPVSAWLWKLVTDGNETGERELPATDVSWHECSAFARFLSMNDPVYDYSLPTDAQWDSAVCRTQGKGSNALEHSICHEWCSSRYDPFNDSDRNDRRRVGPGYRVMRFPDIHKTSYGQVPWHASKGSVPLTGFRLVRSRKETK